MVEIMQPHDQGVEAINGLTGDVTLAAGTNITITPSGQTIIISSTGGGGSAAWGTIGAGTGVGSQTDLVTYLNANYYPLGSNPSGYLTDAPSNGNTYGRKNGAWSSVAGGSMVYPGAGIPVSTGTAWGTSISGTSSQFVKGDGSLDSTTYLSSLSGALLATGATTGATTSSQKFTNGVTIGVSTTPAIGFDNGSGVVNAGLSWGAAGTIYVGNGTAGNVTGTIVSTMSQSTNIRVSGTPGQLTFYGGTIYDTGISRGASAGQVLIGNAAATANDQSGSLITNTGQLNEIIVTPLATPVASTFTTATTGGTLAQNTTYYYRVAATDATGTTLAFAEVSKITGNTTGTNTITVVWLKVTGATGYKVYGRTTGAELLMATITSGSTLTWVDTGSVTPSGALPGANTTGKINATNLPTGTLVSPPSGLNIGDFWLDTTTSSQYPDIRMRAS
jgi:hypothetical protein